MIKKRENCLYCNKKMESKTAKKKFCCASHRLNYHREVKRGTIVIEDKNLEAFVEKNKKENIIPIKAEKSKVMEDMERRLEEIQKKLLNKK